MNELHATPNVLLLFVLAAVLIGVTAQQGFGDAWVSQYTFASAPAKKDAAPKPAAPPGTQQPDSVMQPKPVALSKRVAEYHIDVQLQENAHMLQGEQTVTWTNPGKQPVSEHYFHLYPNAFAPRTPPSCANPAGSFGRTRQHRTAPAT